MMSAGDGALAGAGAERPIQLRAPSRETLADQIAAQLTSAIVNGHYPAGLRLIESNLAEQMNTSRGPIREALRQLSHSGLIEIRPRQGCFVTAFAETDWAEMVVMRAVLEGLAARLVATTADSANFSLLENRAEGIADAAHDPIALRQADWHFHEELCRLAGNGLLLKQWTAMRDAINVLMSQGRTAYADPSTVAQSHRDLVAFLRNGDPPQCERHFRDRLLKAGFSWLDIPVPEALQ